MNEVLTISRAQKRFGGLVAVDDVTFAVGEREMVGLLGPNGSGKSTLLNLISGAASPSGGEIRLRGHSLSGLRPERIAHRGIGRTFQLVRLASGLNALDNVKLAVAWSKSSIWGTECTALAQAALERVGLPSVGNTMVGDLNYIDQKRVELARAIATSPTVLLLDEWLAGLNPTELRQGIELVQQLASSGMTIILVEHIMEAVRQLCPRVVVMEAGRLLADGPTAQVLKRPEVIRAYLGSEQSA